MKKREKGKKLEDWNWWFIYVWESRGLGGGQPCGEGLSLAWPGLVLALQPFEGRLIVLPEVPVIVPFLNSIGPMGSHS